MYILLQKSNFYRNLNKSVKLFV